MLSPSSNKTSHLGLFSILCTLVTFCGSSEVTTSSPILSSPANIQSLFDNCMRSFGLGHESGGGGGHGISAGTHGGRGPSDDHGKPPAGKGHGTSAGQLGGRGSPTTLCGSLGVVHGGSSTRDLLCDNAGTGFSLVPPCNM